MSIYGGKVKKTTDNDFNPLPNDKILDQVQFKLKAFADYKLIVIQIEQFILDKIENIIGKEENAGPVLMKLS